MKRLLILVTAACLGASLSAPALTAAPQDPQAPPAAKPADKPTTIAGKWVATVDAPTGPTEVTLDLKLDGKKVSGTLSGQQGTSAIDGEFADNKLTFTISLDTPQGPFAIVFNATLKDDVFTGTADAGQMGQLPFKAERAKDK